jgi:hypothetical protein
MRWLAIPLMIVSLVMIAPACAQLPAPANAAPTFSAADRIVIARNQMLQSIVEQEPALVRRVLDALAAIENVQPRSSAMPNDSQAAPGPPSGPGGTSSNPDLDRLERTSPEAANDLFQLLKQAATRRRPSR